MAIPPIKIQETNTYCGPACAQSILEELGIVRSQETLYRHIRKSGKRDKGKRGKKWSSSPDGLTNVLNWYQNKFIPPFQACDFELYDFKRKRGVAGQMKRAIAKFNVPCINLVDPNGAHWIVIYGCQSPSAGIPEGFFIVDPLPDSTEGFINYFFWSIKRAFPVDKGYWKGKYLAICDPDQNKKKSDKEKSSKITRAFPLPGRSGKFIKAETPVGDKPVSSAAKPIIFMTPTPKPGKSFFKDPIAGKKNLIDEPTARAYSDWWLNSGGFYNSKMFKLFIPTLRAGSPVLVQELDGPDYYYLVPFLDANNKIYAMMNTSAENADFQEFMSSMDMKKSFSFEPLTDNQIEGLIKKKYPSVNVKTGMSIHKALVWKYCKQSISAYQPFHMVTMGKRTVFIRLDRKLFTKLT